MPKIGKTGNLGSRLRTLQNASAHALQLVMYLPGMGWQEKVWHAAFCDTRRRGEWFIWEPTLQRAIEAARAGEEWIATLEDDNPAAGRGWRDIIADMEEVVLDRAWDSIYSALPPQATGRGFARGDL